MSSTLTTLVSPRARGITATLVVLLALAVMPHTAAASPPDNQQLNDFATFEPINGTVSLLERNDDGVESRIRTVGAPGHVMTIWYVVFNAPDNCTGECNEDDLFNNAVDPSDGFNMIQIAAARISVVFGGGGAIVNPGGRLSVNGGLAAGTPPDGPRQVVIGLESDGALVPEAATGAVTTGLEDGNAMDAEIHVVLQDHGPAHEDPELLQSQLTGFRTACNPTPASEAPPEGSCDDVQFAAHKS